MKMFKSFDTIRGATIFMMVLVHITEWWIQPQDFWLVVARGITNKIEKKHMNKQKMLDHERIIRS